MQPKCSYCDLFGDKYHCNRCSIFNNSNECHIRKSQYKLDDFLKLTEQNSENIHIGDYVVIDLFGYEVQLVLLDFNKDVEADSNNLTNATFGIFNIPHFYQMDQNRNASAGWEDSQIRNKVLPVILKQLPKSIRDRIKTVKKKYYTHEKDAEYNNCILESKDGLFLFSADEITGKYNYDKCEQYKFFEFNNIQAVMDANVVWTRNNRYKGGFLYSSGTNYISTISASVTGKILCGFCI